MAANHRDSYVVQATMGQLIALIRDPHFSTALNIEMKSENPSPPGVWYRFHHGVSFTSWGEKITITLMPLDPYNVRIDIHSECGMPTQIIDYGRNKRNVCNIFEYIVPNLARFAGAATPTVAPNTIPLTAPNAFPLASPTKYCTGCGAQIGSTARFCTACGAQQP